MGSLQDELRKHKEQLKEKGLVVEKPSRKAAGNASKPLSPKKKSLEQIIAEQERRERRQKKDLFKEADKSLRIQRENDASSPSKKQPKTAPLAPKPVLSAEIKKPVRKPNLGPVIESRIARSSDFKSPDGWVMEGRDLLGPFSKTSTPAELYLGIDFGTAFTKAAVGFSEKVFIIDWAGLTKSDSKYLLAGEISELRDKRVFIGRSDAAESIYGNLKLPFLAAGRSTREEKARAVCFLAWVMRYMRAWIYKNMRDEIGNRRPAWNLNLGLPAESVDDIALSTAYEDVAKAAWILSKQDVLTIESAIAGLGVAEKKPAASFGIDDLQLQPEFLAQIAGYMQSPQRTNGMHLLVDIGAGTADCALFMHYQTKDGEFKNTIHRASVDPNGGSHFLLKNRFVKNQINMVWDDLVRIPSAAAFARELGIEKESIDKADRQFSNRLNDQIVDLVNIAKKETYPLAPEWCPNAYGGPPEGLKYFLVGGGSECGVFGTAVVTAAHRAAGAPAKKAVFPTDHTLDTRIDEQIFQRVSVAYGLARDTYDFGELQNAERARQIAEEYAVLLDREKQQVRQDRDDLYPK